MGAAACQGRLNSVNGWPHGLACRLLSAKARPSVNSRSAQFPRHKAGKTAHHAASRYTKGARHEM